MLTGPVNVRLDLMPGLQNKELGMRLTLRTLLAWLDDTLDPNQVREIGKQVAESPFAQELSDRIHRVTRQRRLSVPSSSGADAIDPNVVASYLDNDLDPDSVAEFEKKCLTTDVNLAEVASVHQILSLLGQKVQVPPEARTRMYQLVKGRETVARKRSARRRPPAPEPVTKPIQPWVVPDIPKRPWIERLRPRGRLPDLDSPGEFDSLVESARTTDRFDTNPAGSDRGRQPPTGGRVRVTRQRGEAQGDSRQDFDRSRQGRLGR